MMRKNMNDAITEITKSGGGYDLFTEEKRF